MTPPLTGGPEVSREARAWAALAAFVGTVVLLLPGRSGRQQPRAGDHGRMGRQDQ